MSKENNDENLRILNAFEDFPKPKWNADRKIFYTVSNKCSLHGNADSKISVFKDRYNLILQRLKRSTLFANPTTGFQLTPVDALIGSPGKKFVLGLLTQIKEGTYFLEDPKGAVPISFDENTEFSTGMFNEGCIVLAEGEYSDSDGVFKTTSIGHPLSENRAETKKVLGGLDLFAPPRAKSVSSKYAMFQVDESNSMDVDMPLNSEFVVLSDVHLDKPKVLEKLKVLFQEYADEPPTMFVLMGNFTSVHRSLEENIEVLRNSLSKLADLIISFPLITHDSKFVFIPGPTDPAGAIVNILPKPALPKIATQDFLAKIPEARFASNPCRIRYHGQDLVLFREDLVSRMKRHVVKPPQNDEGTTEITQHLVKTICDEAHLCPLPLSLRPVYWNYDHAMYLYPLPEVIILGDKFDQYEHSYDECLCFNPGSFATDYSFVAYRPGKKEPQFSRIDD